MTIAAICAILFLVTIPVAVILGGIALHLEQPRKRRQRRAYR